MKLTLLSAVAALSLASVPAFAWTNTNNGPGPKQIVDGGPGAQATGGKAVSTSTSTAISAAAANSASRATGGAGGNARAAGGGGGSANVNGGGATNSNNWQGSAPSFSLPSFGGGGMDCPTVGFGAAGSGLGGGGGFGPSWISSDCNHRKVADLLAGLYGPAVARAYVEKNIAGVREAVAAASQGNHTDPVPVQPVSDKALPYCGLVKEGTPCRFSFR